MKTKKDLSIIVPVYNEQDSLSQLYLEIKNNVDDKYNWELIFVNDGSSDKSKEIILDLVNSDPNVKLIDFLINKGKSEALNAGFKKCVGEVVITLDADLQDNPNEIEAFVTKVKETSGLVSGWKKNRLDSFSKRIQSKIFNFAKLALTIFLKLWGSFRASNAHVYVRWACWENFTYRDFWKKQIFWTRSLREYPER